MNIKTVFGLLIVGVITASASQAAQKALIYDGEGVCEDGCAQAAYNLALYSGFDPVYIGPNALTARSTAAEKEAIFADVAVWVQPGGYASRAMKAMTPQLKDSIVEFVKNGGGYVGFCAGAFVTTARVGTTRNKGLNLFPGGTRLFGTGIDLKKIIWNGKERYMYWEGGPYLRNLPSSVEVTATYADKSPVSARTKFGKGRVYITGVHPEAPKSWIDYTGEVDPDGLDYDLGLEMFQWVTAK